VSKDFRVLLKTPEGPRLKNETKGAGIVARERILRGLDYGVKFKLLITAIRVGTKTMNGIYFQRAERFNSSFMTMDSAMSFIDLRRF
jgi:hypothetical protein